MSESSKLAVIQVRSGVSPGRKAEFVSAVLDFARKSAKFGQVVLLTSFSAEERVDSQLSGTPLRYLTTKTDVAEFE